MATDDWDVFIDAVRDHLNGTPNANHPVQFEAAELAPGMVVACTLCGALVMDTEEWRKTHRDNHDKHNGVHARIERQAGSYVPPPLYGGRSVVG